MPLTVVTGTGSRGHGVRPPALRSHRTDQGELRVRASRKKGRGPQGTLIPARAGRGSGGRSAALGAAVQMET